MVTTISNSVLQDEMMTVEDRIERHVKAMQIEFPSIDPSNPDNMYGCDCGDRRCSASIAFWNVPGPRDTGEEKTSLLIVIGTCDAAMSFIGDIFFCEQLLEDVFGIEFNESDEDEEVEVDTQEPGTDD